MQTTSIIETKLMPTFVSRSLLSRDHLVRRIHANRNVRLVVVHGEAGAGKSSLLYAYTQQSPTPVAWYSLQETDREPRVFLTYLLHALHRTYPGSMSRSLAHLSQEPSGSESWESLLVSAINELVQYGHGAALVLDDFHVVQDAPAIADMLTFLVRNGPPNLLLLLATRTAPTLALPYLRAKGLLVEIPGDDLRFSAEEIERVFRDVWQVPIDRELAQQLLDKTEGWVTGLQLVSQAVYGRAPDYVRRYVDDLRGRDQFIYDYLATEVYGLQPPDIRDFLKRTSILGRFNARLAHVVTAIADCDAMLARLEALRLFLVHLDNNREWFRYHHLFADFLRGKLRVEEGAERVRALHFRAAQWFERSEDPATAVEHYFEAGDLDSVVRVLEQRGPEMLACGLQRSLEGWIERLPSDIRGQRPALVALRAELKDMSGEWTRAVELFERAASIYRAEGRRAEAARVLESLMVCLMKYGEADRVISICESALADDPDPSQRASLSARLGGIYVTTGRDWERGYELIRASHEMAFKSGDPRAIAWAAVIYGFAYHFPQGNFLLAERSFNEGVDLFRSIGWAPMMYQLIMNKCVVLIFKGDLLRAHDLIEDTIAMALQAGHTFIVQALELSRAMVALDRGEYHRCDQSFAQLSERLVPAQIRPWYYRTLMLLRARQGRLDQAQAAGEEMMRALVLAGRGMYALECLVSLSEYYLHRGDLKSALATAADALALALEARSRFWEMRAQRMTAAVLRKMKTDVESLRRALRPALVLTRDHDYAESWITDADQLSVSLLAEAIGLGVEVEFARQLLARWGDRLPPLLTPLAEEGSWRVRKVAIEFLGRLEPSHATPVLKRARKDPSREVRATARKLTSRPPERIQVDIRTFGTFQLLVNGEPVSIKGRIPVQILKYLLAHYESPVAPDVLIEQFWPDVDLEKGKRNLTVHINLLRRAIHPDLRHGRALVRLHHEGYGVSTEDSVSCDLAEFDRLVQQGTALAAEGDLGAAHARFLRAEALCARPFLEADVYEDWLQARREKVAQRYRTVILFLADRAMDSDDHAAAASWLRKQLARDPLDELVLQRALRCYQRIGDSTSAQREYDEFRRTLAREAEAEPAAETVLLARHLNIR